MHVFLAIANKAFSLWYIVRTHILTKLFICPNVYRATTECIHNKVPEVTFNTQRHVKPALLWTLMPDRKGPSEKQWWTVVPGQKYGFEKVALSLRTQTGLCSYKLLHVTRQALEEEEATIIKFSQCVTSDYSAESASRKTFCLPVRLVGRQPGPPQCPAAQLSLSLDPYFGKTSPDDREFALVWVRNKLFITVINAGITFVVCWNSGIPLKPHETVMKTLV